MKHNKLFEGVKFGDKEKQLILQNSEDFNIGIEYEFNPEDNDTPDPESIVDFDQNIYDILTDIKRFYDDNSDDLDDTYTTIVVDVLNEYDVNGILPYGVYELYKLFKEFTRELHNMMPTDTVTDDMFSDEKATAYMKFFYTTIKNSDLDVDKIYQTLNDDDLKDSNNFSMLMDIMDVYFEGEFIKGSVQKKKSFFELYSLYSEKSDIFDLEDEDMDDQDVIERYKDDATTLLEALMTSDFKEVYKDEEHNYTVSEYGFSNGDFDINDYIMYVTEYKNIEPITDEIINVFRNSVMDGDFSLDDVIDEERIRREIGNIDRIEDEHDDMKEVITNKMQLSVALENIKRMFEYLSQSASVNDYAGMHISISTNKYDLDDFNIMKFVTLMHIPYILQYFPMREHVDDLQEIIEKKTRRYFFRDLAKGIEKDFSISDFVKNLVSIVESKINRHKFQTINFGTYNMYDGRIELRFFGGQDYHTQYEEIVNLLLRALYMMNISYTDVYINDYYKQMVKIINKSISEVAPVSFTYLYSSLNKISKKFNLEGMFDYYSENDDIPDDFRAELKRYFKDSHEAIFKMTYAGWLGG